VSVTIPEQRYGPTTGTVTGWIGLVACATIGGGLLIDPDVQAVRFALVFAILGLVTWCYLLRPRIVIREPAALLILRNAFSSWLVPLPAITVVRVKAYTRVEVGDEGYDAIAVGRRVRVMLGGARPRRSDRFVEAGFGLGEPAHQPVKRGSSSTPEAVADLMTEQVLAAAQRAKEAGQPVVPVLRSWATVELTLLAGLLLGFAATYLV